MADQLGAVVAIMLLAAPVAAALGAAAAVGRPRDHAGDSGRDAGTAPLIAVHFETTSLVFLPARDVLAAPAVAPVMWLGMATAAVAR